MKREVSSEPVAYVAVRPDTKSCVSRSCRRPPPRCRMSQVKEAEVGLSEIRVKRHTECKERATE